MIEARDRLTAALKNAHAPADLIARAQANYYSGFLSGVAMPRMKLVNHLLDANLPILAARAKEGDFDPSDEEIEAWAKSTLDDPVAARFTEARAQADIIQTLSEVEWTAPKDDDAAALRDALTAYYANCPSQAQIDLIIKRVQEKINTPPAWGGMTIFSKDLEQLEELRKVVGQLRSDADVRNFLFIARRFGLDVLEMF